MATNRPTRARTQRVDRARKERERQTGRDKEARERDRDRPAADRQDYRVDSRGDRDRDYRDDDGGDRYYGITRTKRDVERIASAWTRASARLFAGTTDVLSNLVENLSDTFLYRDGGEDDRGRPSYRSSSRRGGRGRSDYDDYDRPRRGRRGGSSRFVGRADDVAGDLSAAVRDAAEVFTRAADSFSRVYEDRDDAPRGRRRVYRDDDDDNDRDSRHRDEEPDRGHRLTVDTGPKHFAVEAESKDRGEGKHSSAGEEDPRESEE